MSSLKLPLQILAAIVLAAICGAFTQENSAIFGINVLAFYDFIGTLFLNALKMLIVPLIATSLISGVAKNQAQAGNLGKLGSRTIIYYLTTSFLAVITGLLFVNAIEPGLSNGVPVANLLGLSAQLPSDLLQRASSSGASDIVHLLQRMVPSNIIDAAANGEMLGLIFFSFLFGYFMMKTGEEQKQSLQSFWEGSFATMMYITLWIMRFAPIGVFGLVAKTTTTAGFAAIKPLAWFFVCVLASLAFHFAVNISLILRYVAKVKPLAHFKAMLPALLTAFSTASSSASLPFTLQCVEKRAGVSNRVTSFVLPLGATVNMDGTALYECVAALFIAQAYGLKLALLTQLSVVIIAVITSIGVAGIPSASLVAISIILTSVGLPLEGLGLLLITDRLLDMFRTAVNVFSDATGAVVMARLAGEQTLIGR